MDIINNGINLMKQSNKFSVTTLYNYKSVLKKIVNKCNLNIEDYNWPNKYCFDISLHILEFNYYSIINIITALTAWVTFFSNDRITIIIYNNMLSWNRCYKDKKYLLDGFSEIENKCLFLYNYFSKLINGKYLNDNDFIKKLSMYQDILICYFCTIFNNLNVEYIQNLTWDEYTSLNQPLFCNLTHIIEIMDHWKCVSSSFHPTLVFKKITKQININMILSFFLNSSYYQIKVYYHFYELQQWEHLTKTLEYI